MEEKTPKGFTRLFNGKDLTGWRGRQPNYNPAEEAKLPKEELAAKQAGWNAARDLHWKVDVAKGGGPIELQTHGSEIRFRNIYIREISAKEANEAIGTPGIPR